MNRRGLLAGTSGLAFAVAKPIGGKAQALDSTDERFMRLALVEARLGDLPFGAVIVRDGTVMARGNNSDTRDGDPTAHGEMNAIRSFLANHGPDPLKGAAL